MEVFVDNLIAEHGRLNQILKAIQQPVITIDHAENLYNEGSNILKNIEELKSDVSCHLSKGSELPFADIRQKEHKLHYIYSRIITENKRELEKKKLQDNQRIITIAIVVTGSAGKFLTNLFSENEKQ